MTELSIKDLCAPISAKVMPRSQLYASDNTERTQEDARKKQRQSESVRVYRKRKSRKEYGA